MFLASLLGLSRLQFALTAMFHWIFVPLTIGLGIIIAIMETYYVRTGNEFWKRTTKFWMKIFAINFAIGVATGIILEFQFGTNWSNYSWFVGDIFGAPLAIEGIFAFFLETTFFAIMFFGWNKVSKNVHLLSTWLVAIGTILSALWILVANAWMQYPVGMEFNPDTARNEMVDFWAVALSPVALNKFIHTVSNCFVHGGVVVVGISSWYLLRKREEEFARKSIRIAAVFGLISLVVLIWSGDGSAYHVAKKQPMKLAAMEGLYISKPGTPIVAFGILNPNKTIARLESDSLGYALEKPYLFNISIPQGLSLLVDRKLNTFVPGIEDIIQGGYTYVDELGNEKVALPVRERMKRGKIAIDALALYHKAKDASDEEGKALALGELKENFSHFGYGFIEKPTDIVPNVPLTFYAFRIMVILGGFFIAFLGLAIYLERRALLSRNRWFLYLSIVSIPLVYICTQAGWIVAEVGRQPWTIQDLLTTGASVSGVSTSSVATTTIMFFVLFSVLLAAELAILFKVIKKGPSA
ncbi:MAG: cytochrome C oxidase subunit II [Bacteroidetes bacterium GWF2_41_61]|nr:MAG: cytochrome C oxidase subunit II [Bacteroidetes bacterium GWE2_40_15]OFY36786.1 MAG: cytochrome C oxidase subunit II [Bacteroidetes bacterium GWF2_41_61]OFY88728.1 MAG: cytochrome C oxidase subunit II [Bacteroidetes bacterium RIFOXYA12_FULL_40_10]HBG23865.1 cytochrome ubiquinol oxidase subunit I [Rikenellaceae bacterium]HBZ26034.1 cytochrome ubiquinol oxidase subunit I [Rikenellaceae bacterium]